MNIFIIPLSVKSLPWYIELFELCKTLKSRHLNTEPMYLRHAFARSKIMDIISLLANKIESEIKLFHTSKSKYNTNYPTLESLRNTYNII